MRKILILLALLAVAGCAGNVIPRADALQAGAVAELRYDSEAGMVSAIAIGPEDAPRIIFIHGTPGSKEAFQAYLEEAPPGRRYICYDRPGFGESAPEAVESFDDQIKALEPLLVVQDGKAPILVGHSLGGPLALYAAITYPDRVGAVVSLAGSADPSLEKIHPMQYVGDSALGRLFLPTDLYNANRELFAHKRELEKLGALLPQLRAPVMVVHGASDDLVPVGNVSYLMKNIVGVTRLDHDIIAGQDHFLPWNNPRAVKSAIERAVRMGWEE